MKQIQTRTASNVNLNRIMNCNVKVVVFCVVVIASVSNNGKASVNDLVPNSKILFEDNTKISDESCYRPCKFNVKPRRCFYKFKIEPTLDDQGQISIAINNMVPGPSIHVCVNDVVVVEVHNKVPDQDLAIHWHGVDQFGTPHMDGVPMVTQCPINFGSTYKYAFRASNPGTHFYHAHSVLHQADGVFGAFVVNQPSPLDANSPLYDYDRSKENTLIISTKFPKLFTSSLEDLSEIRPSAMRINRQENGHKIFVKEGYAYRLRIINAAVNCPVRAHLSGHELLVIASDGQPVKPVVGSGIALYPGERMDVVIRSNKKPQAYWFHVNGLDKCDGLHSKVMVVYTGFNYTSMLMDNVKTSSKFESEAIYGQYLESPKEAWHVSEVKKVYLGIKRAVVQFEDSDNDFRYISDAIAKKPFYPSQLTLRENGVVQINAKSFLYPNAPFLTQFQDVKEDALCEIGDKHENPQCVVTLTAPLNSVLELIFANEDDNNSNEQYVFHLHGYKMQMLTTHLQSEGGTPVSLDAFNELDEKGQIKRNTLHPPFKDTLIVPYKGYTIARVTLDHAGAWLLECRSCGLSSLPTAFIINVPQKLPKTVLDSLPKCGNYRPPDVLLN